VSVQSTSAAATAIAGTDLVGCTVPDLQKSLAFYRDTLGMEPSVVNESGAEFHLPDGTTFGLWQPPESEDFEYGFAVMFTVADAAGAVAAIRERGGTISDPFESPVCYMAIGKDSEGNGVIVHQKKARDEHRPSGQPRTLTTINGIDIAGFFASNPERAIAFIAIRSACAPPRSPRAAARSSNSPTDRHLEFGACRTRRRADS